MGALYASHFLWVTSGFRSSQRGLLVKKPLRGTFGVGVLGPPVIVTFSFVTL